MSEGREDRSQLPEQEMADPTLESRIFRLADSRQGRLTVSEVVIDAGLPVSTADRVLDRMIDGVRVRIEFSENGLTIYEFPEIMERHRSSRQHRNEPY